MDDSWDATANDEIKAIVKSNWGYLAKMCQAIAEYVQGKRGIIFDGYRYYPVPSLRPEQDKWIVITNSSGSELYVREDKL